MSARHRVVALSGGVGGAKLAWGLAQILPADDLLIVANTGDDFDHLGLRICPDIDTLIYTLAGLADPVRGWGRRDESWNFMAALATLGGEAWFQLGDRDLALHVERTRRLATGESLAAITQDLARRLGVAPLIVPMSDRDVRTIIRTDMGILAFQEYFVREQCRPRVRSLDYRGAADAPAHPAIAAALRDPALLAVVICPSNPFLSIDPILAVGNLRAQLAACAAPVLAVSPIIAGAAIKGPTAKIMTETGRTASALLTAELYADILDAYVLDARDDSEATGVRERLGIPCLVTETLMSTNDRKVALAQEIVRFAQSLGRAA